jgi:hypothetical protein
MFKQTKKWLAGALCALTLATLAVVPAHADMTLAAAGRAGKATNVTWDGNDAVAGRVTGGFEGLVHWILYDTNEFGDYVFEWQIRSADSRQLLMICEAYVDEDTQICYWDGVMQSGEFAGAGVHGYAYDLDRVNGTLKLSLSVTVPGRGNTRPTVVDFIQVVSQIR